MAPATKRRHGKTTPAELASATWGPAFLDYEGDQAVFTRLSPFVIRLLRGLGLDGDDILLVVAVMGHYSPTHPEPYVTGRTLACWTGLGKSTVADRLKRIVDKGLLAVRAGGRGVASKFDPAPLLARLVEEKAKLLAESADEATRALLAATWKVVVKEAPPAPPAPPAPAPANDILLHNWELNDDGLPLGASPMALAVQGLYAGSLRPRTAEEHGRAWAAAQVAVSRDFSGYEFLERQGKIDAFVLAQYLAKAVA
jgi:hypothetical protein